MLVRKVKIMNVSAVNCTPIKPQASFGHDPELKKDKEIRREDYDQALTIIDKLSDEYVKSDDIKNPFQVVLSVVAAGGKSFMKGASTFLGLDLITKGGATNFVKSAGKGVVSSLNKVAEKIGESSAVRKNISGVLNKASESFVNVGSKCKVPVLAGALSALALVPAICSRDNDGDGVKDIIQKSQSAYDNFEKNSSNMLSGASQIAELVSILS